MCDKPRVLFVSLEANIAGAEKSMLLLLRGLRERYALAVACPPMGSLAREISGLGVRRFDLGRPVKRSYYSVWGLFFLINNILRVLFIAWRAKPVILHANSLPAVVAASVPAVIFRKRLVWHVRDFSKCGGLMRLCGLAAWRVIAVSNAIRIHLERQGIDGRKIDVVYNGVDVVEGGVSRGSTGSDKLDFTFANVGQFIPWKKQTDFLDTVDAVTGSIINARFLLVGDDRFGRDSEYKAVILRRVRALRHTNRVRFCGWCDDMAHIWGEIDCLVHTAEQEPFGRVIIEAMMNGVPVIAVDSGGPGEIIRHGITGLLVKPGDSRGLVEAMIKMGRDVQLRTRMMLAAYKDAVSKFRADMPVKRVEEIYKMLLSEKGIPCESV